MGKTLTKAQLAHRAATKRNNHLRKSMPLFAGLLTETGPMADWLTTADEQDQRIQKQRKEFEAYWARLGSGEHDFKDKGDEYREILERHVSAELLTSLYAYFVRVLSNHGAAFWADYWWGKLVEYVPQVAHERCPNKQMHDQVSRWNDHCPTCGKPLTFVPYDSHEDSHGVKQLRLQDAVLA